MRPLPRLPWQALLLWHAYVSRCAATLGEAREQRPGGRQRRRARRDLLEGVQWHSSHRYAGLQVDAHRYGDLAGEYAAGQRQQSAAPLRRRSAAWRTAPAADWFLCARVDEVALRPRIDVPIGCPTLATFLFLWLGWDEHNPR